MAWLQPSRRDSQWVKYFKWVILEIPNVWFGSVFLKPATFCVKYKIYSNKAVKHLTCFIQHVPQNKANISLCFLLASDDNTSQICGLCDQSLSICSFLCMPHWALQGPTGLTNKWNDWHKLITHVAMLCQNLSICMKLVGSIKYWLYFVAHVGSSELDAWPLY